MSKRVKNSKCRHNKVRRIRQKSRRNTLRSGGITAIAAAGGLGLQSAPALAQEALEEIVVTATRRSMSIQDIPYNISAISGDGIERAGVGDLGDLLRLVPGVAFLDQGARIGGNNPNIILRGINANAMIGSFDFPNVAVAPISTYLNETPVFFPLQLNDLERVEVLRGPQGTIYGSGAMGGTLKLMTKRPDPGVTSVDIRGGTFWTKDSDEQSYNLNGTLNVPLGETWTLRVNAGYENVGGFIDANGRYSLDSAGAALPADSADLVNSAPIIESVEDISDTRSRNARAALRFQPNDRVDAVLTYLNQRDESDGRQIQNPFSGSGEDYVEYHATSEPYEREVNLASLEVDVDFGFATLTSATSVYENKSDQSIDYTDFWTVNVEPYYYSAFPRVIAPEQSITKDEGLIQELRLRSNGEGKVDWLVGAFYSDVRNDVLSLYTVPGAPAWNDLTRVAGDPPPYSFANNSDVNAIFDRKIVVKDLAAFGELTYHVSDQWQVTLGARVFSSDFEQDLVEFLPQCGYYCATDGVDPNGAILANVQQDDSDSIFKLNTSYAFSDDLMLYGTWVEGYRRGGGNIALLTHPFLPDPPELLTYRPDSADNWEIGLKGRIEDRVQYTLAAFYIDWEDPQIDAFTPFGNPAVVNGEGARTQGLEMETFGNLTDHLSFSFGYAYTSAELTADFTAPDGSTGSDGDSLPGVPEHMTSLTLDYQQTLSSNLFSGVNYHLNGFYRSKTDSAFQGIRLFEIDGFSIWDVSATFASRSESWSVTAFVDNVFDEPGVTGGIPAARNGPAGQFYFVTRPRNYGIRFTYHSK
tara:strand:- start:3894 stop:6326 length:2433 start_codon:yes stop_codon:yes gene_type:complete